MRKFFEDEELDQEVLGGRETPVPAFQPAAVAEEPPQAKAKRLVEAFKASPRPEAPSSVEDLREARQQDELANGVGRVSDALYGAFTRTPAKFQDRGPSRAGQVMQEQALEAQAKSQREKEALKDPTHERNRIYREYLKREYPEIFSHYPPELFERITRADEDVFDMKGLLRRLSQRPSSTLDPLLEEKRRRLEAQIDKDHALADRARRPAGEKGADGKTLSAATLEELADFDVAAGELDKLEQSFTDLDQGSTTAKYSAKATQALGLQDTDAAKYQAEAKRVMQSVGKILEGGKLAAGDEVKYRELLPKSGDSADVLRRKIDGLKAFLADIKQKRVSILQAGGYKTPVQVNRTPIPQGLDLSKDDQGGGLSPEKKARLEELRAKKAAGALK